MLGWHDIQQPNLHPLQPLAGLSVCHGITLSPHLITVMVRLAGRKWTATCPGLVVVKPNGQHTSILAGSLRRSGATVHGIFSPEDGVLRCHSLVRGLCTLNHDGVDSNFKSTGYFDGGPLNHNNITHPSKKELSAMPTRRPISQSLFCLVRNSTA